jgi:hypothetical protein
MVYLDSINILTILLKLESGCHTTPAKTTFFINDLLPFINYILHLFLFTYY